MYIDATKFDYSKFRYPDAAQLVARDKEAARAAYKKWMADNAASIVDRQWEIDDIGAVERVGDFIKLLKEAEFTYALGAYTSTIAMVGVCAEDLCRFFADSAGSPMDSLTQHNRLRALRRLNLITDAVLQKFHVIRELRNDCLHFNAGFKQKTGAELGANALEALNTLKAVYAEIVGVVDYTAIDSSKVLALVDVITKEAAGSGGPGSPGPDGALARTRNLFAGVFGFDLSLNNAAPVYNTSMYEVLDIDLETETPEASLRDLGSGLIVVVDLTESDVKAMQAEGISDGNLVSATLMSVPNELQTTGIWRLWSPMKKLSD
jgi:hypothetical protein